MVVVILTFEVGRTDMTCLPWFLHARLKSKQIFFPQKKNLKNILALKLKFSF